MKSRELFLKEYRNWKGLRKRAVTDAMDIKYEYCSSAAKRRKKIPT